MICRAIDGIYSDKPVTGKVKDGECIFFRVSRKDMPVGIKGQACRLQLHIALIRPEPCNFPKRRLAAHNGTSDMLCLICRILHRFKPHPTTGLKMIIAYAIADSVDVARRRAQVLIHNNAVVDRKPSHNSKLHVWHRTRTDHNHIGREFGSVCSFHACHATIFTLNGRHAETRQNCDTGGAAPRFHVGGDVRCNRTPQHTRCCLDQNRFFAKRDRAMSHFQTNKAAANNDHILNTGHCCRDAAGILHPAERENTVKLDT